MSEDDKRTPDWVIAAEYVGSALLLIGLSEWAFSQKTKERIREKYNYTCASCGKPTHRGECHHILPQSKGGSDRADNGVYLCGPKDRDCHAYYDKLALEQGILWDGREINLRRRHGGR